MFDPDMTFQEFKLQYVWIKKSGYCTIQHLHNRLNVYHGTQISRFLSSEKRIINYKLGERLVYSFKDAKVETIDAIIQRAKQSLQNDLISLMQRVRRTFYNNRTTAQTEWLEDIYTQTFLKLKEMEINIWYFIFDELIELLECNGKINQYEEKKILDKAISLCKPVRSASDLFFLFAKKLDKLNILEGALVNGKWRHGAAWLNNKVKPNVAYVWLHSGEGFQGFSAKVGYKGNDSFSNSCKFLRFDRIYNETNSD